MASNAGNIKIKLNLDAAAYEQGIREAVGSVHLLESALGALGIGFGAVQIKQFISDMSRVSVEMDGLTNKFDAAAGGALYGANSMQFVKDECKKLGLVFETSAQSFSGFDAAALRSGLSLQETKSIFDDIARAATALHLSGRRTELVFLALEQMASKGVVSMEELRRQLGDNLPGAFEIAAKAMGVSTAKFNEMVSNGEVMSSEFLPKFAKAIREELGGTAEIAATQANAAFNRWENSIFNISDTIGDGLNPVLAELATNGTSIVDGLNEDIRATYEWAETNQEALNSVKNLGLALVTIATTFTGLVAVVGKVSKVYKSATAAIKAMEAANLAAELAAKEAYEAECALYAARLRGSEASIRECVAIRASTAAKAAETAATAKMTKVTAMQYLATGNLSKAFKVAAASVRSFTVALLANPWTWVALGITAVAGAIFAYKNNVESTKKAIDDLNNSQDQQVHKTVEAMAALKDLGTAKNLDYDQTKRLDSAISYLTEKYPNYIDKLRKELELKGKISDATAQQIANEMMLAKVKGLQKEREKVDKDMRSDRYWSNLVSPVGYLDRKGPGRYGVTKANQKRDDALKVEQKKLEAERQAIINDLTEFNKPSAITGFDNSPHKKGKTAAQQAAEEKRRRKEVLDYKLALLEIEKYETQKTDEELYQIELRQADLRIASAKKGTSDYAQALAAKLKLEREYEKKLRELKSEQLVDDFEYSRQEIDATNMTLELQYEAQKISKIKLLELEIANINKKKELERQALFEQLKLVEGNIAEEVKLRRASNKTIEGLDRDLMKKSIELQNEKRVAFKTFASDVSSGWGNTVSELIRGEMTFADVFSSLTDSVINAFGNACGRMVEKWLENHITMETATKAFSVAKMGWDRLISASNAEVAATNVATAASNTALAGSGAVLTGTNTALAVSNSAVAASSATAAASTASSAGIMTGAAAGLGTAMGAILTPVASLSSAFATLAISTATVALTMPVIAVATTVTALSAALAALSLGLMNVTMALTATTSMMFAPISVMLAAEFGVIGAAASIAAKAVASLAIALAAASAAAIPFVGWALAPMAATMTGAAIAAADTMVQFREKGGPVKAGQPYIVGEKRPELFVPDRNGTILPDTSALNGGGGTTHNEYITNAPVTVIAADAKSFEGRIDELTDRIHANLSKKIRRRKLTPLTT